MGNAGHHAELTFASARSLSLVMLTHAFNRGFEGYLVPIAQTSDSLLRMLRENDAREEESLVALTPDGEPVGVALLSRRGARAWVAGMGIAPEWRGQGYGAALLGRLLERARELGVRVVSLEVLEENSAARSLYERLGFRETRRLAVYTGKAKTGTREALVSQRNAICALPVAEALAHYDALHRMTPPWQREQATLARMATRLKAICLAGQASPMLASTVPLMSPVTGPSVEATLLYSLQPQGYSLLDIGVRAGTVTQRRANALALVRYILRERPDALLRAINVPPGDPLGEALDALGCPIVARQREMALTLT